MNIAEQIPYFADLPKWGQVLVLNLLAVAFGLIVISILRNLATRVLMRGLRYVANRTTYDTDNKIADALERPMQFVVIGIGLAVVATIFSFSADIDRFVENIARSLFILGIILFIYHLIDIIGVTSANLKRITGLEVQERLLPFMRTVVKVLIVLVGLLMVVQEFDYSITGLVASFGVVGLALSLAAQDTAANVFGFTAIVSDNPFNVGDYVLSADFEGHVEHVGLRSTRIRRLDQALITVPNSALSDAAVTNMSRLVKRRLDFYIGLTYSTSASQIQGFTATVIEMLKARELVDSESVTVHFVRFGESSLDVRIIAFVWIKEMRDFFAEQEQVNLAIMNIVESLGLSIAFPSRSLYIESLPKSMTEAQAPTKES